jgi:hypothetical protein
VQLLSLGVIFVLLMKFNARTPSDSDYANRRCRLGVEPTSPNALDSGPALIALRRQTARPELCYMVCRPTISGLGRRSRTAGLDALTE